MVTLTDKWVGGDGDCVLTQESTRSKTSFVTRDMFGDIRTRYEYKLYRPLCNLVSSPTVKGLFCGNDEMDLYVFNQDKVHLLDVPSPMTVYSFLSRDVLVCSITLWFNGGLHTVDLNRGIVLDTFKDTSVDTKTSSIPHCVAYEQNQLYYSSEGASISMCVGGRGTRTTVLSEEASEGDIQSMDVRGVQFSNCPSRYACLYIFVRSGYVRPPHNQGTGILRGL